MSVADGGTIVGRCVEHADHSMGQGRLVSVASRRAMRRRMPSPGASDCKCLLRSMRVFEQQGISGHAKTVRLGMTLWRFPFTTDNTVSLQLGAQNLRAS